MALVGRDNGDMGTSRSVFGIMAIVLAVALAGCGSSDQRSVKAPTATTVRPATSSTTSTTTTAAPAPTALDQLAPFVAAARTLDGQLHTAAVAINGAGPPWHTIPASVVDAVNAADTGPAEHALPAGMPAAVEQPAMLVFSDLVSRRAALRDFGGESTSFTFPDEASTQEYLLQGLGGGASGAAHFAADLAALETAARAAPAFTPAAADSRAGEELAVLVADVHLSNYGCDGHGWSRMTSLPPIVWEAGFEQGVQTAGRIGENGGTPFLATWTNGAWFVRILAC